MHRHPGNRRRVAERPLAGDLVVADDIHGATGLDGPDLEGPTAEAEPVHAVELTRRLIAGSAEPVTLIATGPLTDIVLRSGVPATMIGLNVTHQALATDEIIAEFRGLGTRVGTACAELMTFFASTYRDVFGFAHPPVHDPIAVAAVADPAILRTVAVPVAVELTGTYTRGATVVDLHHRSGRTPQAVVAVGLDVPAFWRMLMAAVARAQPC
ncbi:nucleoside hydrolase [Actinoplanes sp. NPDC048988]|uniref:nucleoside hydrolase n=1 Tax=Actinoplanes sp. NPDC048988 TaxID=3363901 RepID=UPI003722A78D